MRMLAVIFSVIFAAISPWGAAILILAGTCTLTPISEANQQEIILDTVVATVNEKPITLSDVGKRLSPSRTVTVQELKSTPELTMALEALIYERLILAESERRNMKVGEEDVNRYIQEVTARNGLSPSQMEEILKKEKKSMDEYRSQVRIEILKSRLASSYIRASTAVTEAEVTRYIEENNLSGVDRQLKPGDALIQLRQVLLSKDKYSPEKAQAALREISASLKEGARFEVVARKWSDAPEAAEGGLLGMMAEKDLAASVFDAIMKLEPNEISPVVETATGYHLFEVVARETHEKRASSEDRGGNNQELRSMVRKKLEDEKTAARMASFFETELLKSHTVERKI